MGKIYAIQMKTKADVPNVNGYTYTEEAFDNMLNSDYIQESIINGNLYLYDSYCEADSYCDGIPIGKVLNWRKYELDVEIYDHFWENMLNKNPEAIKIEMKYIGEPVNKIINEMKLKRLVIRVVDKEKLKEEFMNLVERIDNIVKENSTNG